MSDVIGLLGPGILLAAPILYAAIGGLFTYRAGIFNIGLEGFMLISAYFSIVGAMQTHSLLLGTLIGVLAAALAAAVMGVAVVAFRADEVIVGIAINLFALGLTTFLLSDAQTSGQSLDLPSGYPQFHIGLLDGVPVLDQIFNNRDVIIWLMIPLVIGVNLLFRRTSFGLHLKATGEAPLAARAAGVRVSAVRFASVVLSGVLCGVGGAELSIGSVHLFSENMTSGRGIVAFAAVIFGASLVGRVSVACLLFGLAQALAGLLQIRTNFPSQFVLMVPYLVTIVAVGISDALSRRRRYTARGADPGADRSVAAPLVLLGHLTVDEIHMADGAVHPATIGGAAAYAAMGASLAGGDVCVVSRVGDDYPLARLADVGEGCGAIDAGRTAASRGPQHPQYRLLRCARASSLRHRGLRHSHRPDPERERPRRSRSCRAVGTHLARDVAATGRPDRRTQCTRSAHRARYRAALPDRTGRPRPPGRADLGGGLLPAQPRAHHPPHRV